MRASKRRVWLGAVMALSLLAGACTPAPILADTLALSTSDPDLIIETVTWSPEIPSVGDKVTFTVTIKNQGSGQADSSRVAYYIDNTFQTSTYVNPIEPGVTATKTFTWTAEAGSQTIKAVADTNNNVAESNETNNDKTFAFSVLAPDLIIEAITWSPENPSIGDEVVFSVNITNQGGLKAGSSHVDLCIDGNSRGFRHILRIDAGATVTETFNWNALSGLHTIKAVADVLDQVPESDEINNDKTVTYTTAAPDLIISTITWSPENPSEGTKVTISVTIKNQGSGKALNSWVAYLIDNVYESSVFVGQITPGATATKTFTWTAQAGWHTIKAIADANNDVIESDETNNAKSVSPTTPAPDLIVQSITWSPSSPLKGHIVNFTVSIKNQGKSAAGSSRVYFHIDDYYKFHEDIPRLDVGATTTANFSWAIKEDSHVLKAIADAEDSIKETDESNNEKTVNLGVSSPATSDLIVQDIVWSPENPSTEDTVTFTISIKNQGGRQAGISDVAYCTDNTCQTSAYANPIEPGATATQTFTCEPQAGSHTIKVVVDANNAVTESNEANNEKAVTLSILAPDLVIQDITWSPEGLSIGDMVTFTIAVKNQGDYRANRSYLAYYIDGSSRGYHEVPEIDAGANVTKTYTWTAQTGSHVIKAVADMQSHIPESNENNNEKVLIFPPADLIIEKITWSPENPSEDDLVTFSVTIKNQSYSRADSSSVHFYIDGASQGYENVEEIDAGATVTKDFVWEAQVGSYAIKAVADEENYITESDESNNEKAVTFSVSLTPASVLEATSIVKTNLEQPEASVHLYDLISQVYPGEDIVFSLHAVNPAINPVMTVRLVMQVPSGVSVTSSEFVKDDKGWYSASYPVEPGEKRQVEIYMKAPQEKGSFNVLSDLSYYLAEDKSNAEHQLLTMPVTVGTDGASEGESLLAHLPGKGVWLSWWSILVAALIATITVAILRSRRRSH